MSVGVDVVVLLRTRCYIGVFLHATARVHLITVAEQLGARLRESTPTWASTSGWTEKCCITAAKKKPSSSCRIRGHVERHV